MNCNCDYCNIRDSRRVKQKLTNYEWELYKKIFLQQIKEDKKIFLQQIKEDKKIK
jgi:hypothetical protein